MSNINVSSARDHSNEIRRLATLLEISQALSGVINLKASLHSVLDILTRRHEVAGSAVTLFDSESREPHVEAAAGSYPGGGRGRHRHVDGLARRVIDTGKPVVVPRVSDEPALTGTWGDRARAERLTFIGVPVIVNRRPAGILEVALPYKRDRDYDRSLEFYRVVASLIGQAVKVHRVVEADRSTGCTPASPAR